MQFHLISLRNYRTLVVRLKGGNKMTTLKKIKSLRTYNKLLVELVEGDYYPCKTCGRPVRDGYCCTWCGDSDPQSEGED